jgi:predicted nucleotidyltransferase
MDPMALRFEPVLRALNDGGVRYLVVGGVAVVLHDLLVLKRAAGRARDLEDIAVLEAIAQGGDVD